MDPLLAAASSKVLEVIVEKAVARSIGLGWRKLRWLPVVAFNSKQRVRVACSVFLRVQDDKQRFLLIQNLHRPEFFGPIGGCYKYLRGASFPDLERFEYQTDDLGDQDSVRDLRGYVRRGAVADYFNWFVNCRGGRESFRECLSREIEEEIFGECKLIRPSDYVSHDIEFDFVRSYLERSRVAGSGVLQFRLFEIYDLNMRSESSRLLFACLRKQKSRKVLWASGQDIRVGRTPGGKTIGHAATLFISEKITRPDLPLHRK